LKIFLICLVSFVSLHGCMVAESDLSEMGVDTTEQALQTCTAACDPPLWNGVPVSCTASVYCVAGSGHVYCDSSTSTTTVHCSTAPPPEEPTCGPCPAGYSCFCGVYEGCRPHGTYCP
jgi:hypothetical protein